MPDDAPVTRARERPDVELDIVPFLSPSAARLSLSHIMRGDLSIWVKIDRFGWMTVCPLLPPIASIRIIIRRGALYHKQTSPHEMGHPARVRVNLTLSVQGHHGRNAKDHTSAPAMRAVRLALNFQRETRSIRQIRA